MNRIEFIRAIKEVTTYEELIYAYSSMIALNLKMVCYTLDKVNIIEKSFETDELDCRVLKINFGKNMYFNCGIVVSKGGQELYRECIKDVEEVVGYKLHITFIVNRNYFILYDNLCKCVIDEYNYKTKIYTTLDEILATSINNLFQEERENREVVNNTQRSNVGYELNKIYNMNCMDGMRKMGDNSVDFVLTDIPYDGVNKIAEEKRVESTSIRNIDKGDADVLTFNLTEFMCEVERITSNSVCIFCGAGQVSEIYNHLISNGFTTRLIVWEKNNPSPMNGEYVYLSGIEMAVWGKRKGVNGVFNAFCKNTVFKHPSGTREIHPTQKNIQLFEELIMDNTNEGDTVFDPCIGSGTTGEASINTNRNFIGFELSSEFYEKANNRLNRIIMPGDY